jgi:hypothetical protein
LEYKVCEGRGGTSSVARPSCGNGRARAHERAQYGETITATRANSVGIRVGGRPELGDGLPVRLDRVASTIVRPAASGTRAELDPSFFDEGDPDPCGRARVECVDDLP